MPPSDCIHSAARKAWMIHATAKEQRHHRWHSLTLLGRIGMRMRWCPPPYQEPLLSLRQGGTYCGQGTGTPTRIPL